MSSSDSTIPGRRLGVDAFACVQDSSRWKQTVNSNARHSAGTRYSSFDLMQVYNFYLFSRHGTCLYYREWQRTRPGSDTQQEQQNLIGLLFAVKQLCRSLAPANDDSLPIDTATRYMPRGPSNFCSYSTEKYQLHCFESSTGLRFVLTTSPTASDLTRILQRVYREAYVECAIRNPLYTLGTSIVSESFRKRLDSVIRTLAVESTVFRPASEKALRGNGSPATKS